jgi:hypothetical protein
MCPTPKGVWYLARSILNLARFPPPVKHHCLKHVNRCEASVVMENIARQIQNTAPQISETVRKKSHVYIKVFLRMTDTMAFRNIDLSSWDILYKM